jgi:zinc/manganese transport system ATP-binding protein
MFAASLAGMGDDRVAVRLSDASVSLGGRTIWSDVTLEIGAGEFVALLGENGSGKSTMLKVLLGSLRLGSGSVSVLGRAPGEAGATIGYLPQRPSFGAGLSLRGRDLVRLGLDGDRWGLPVPLLPGSAARRRSVREQVDAAIEMVGAGAYADRPIGQCSGGEQQRLLIAQALVRRPGLLLLDEPLDSLDLPNQAAVAALVDRIRNEAGVAVLLVAHDVNPLLGYLDRVVYLAGGRALSGSVGEVINSETLSALYGLPVEVLEASDGRLVVIGTPEAPAHHHDRHDHAHAH